MAADPTIRWDWVRGRLAAGVPVDAVAQEHGERWGRPLSPHTIRRRMLDDDPAGWSVTRARRRDARAALTALEAAGIIAPPGTVARLALEDGDGTEGDGTEGDGREDGQNGGGRNDLADDNPAPVEPVAAPVEPVDAETVASVVITDPGPPVLTSRQALAVAGGGRGTDQSAEALSTMLRAVRTVYADARAVRRHTRRLMRAEVPDAETLRTLARITADMGRLMLEGIALERRLRGLDTTPTGDASPRVTAIQLRIGAGSGTTGTR